MRRLTVRSRKMADRASRVVWMLKEYADPESGAIAHFSEGPVFMSPSLITTVPFDIGWAGIHDLHERLASSAGPFVFSATEGLTDDEAFGQYSSSIANALGQLSVMDPAGANRMLESLVDFGSHRGDLGGLESPFLSAFGVAVQGGPTEVLNEAAQLWGSLGSRLRNLGGGAETTPILSGSGTLTMATADLLNGSLGGPNPDIASIAFGLGDLMLRASSSGAGYVQQSGPTADAARQAGVLTTTGGVLGMAFAGPIGGLIGGGVGFALKHGPVALVEEAVNTATDFVKGAINFFGDLLGLSSTASATAQQPPSPAEKAAQGKCLVAETYVVTTTDRKTQTVNNDGSVTTTEEHTRREERTNEKKCLQPDNPAKCGTGEPGGVEPGFETGFEKPLWKGIGTHSPSLMPIGRGMNHFDIHLGGDVLRLDGLPELDAEGDVIDSGFMEAVIPSLANRSPDQNTVWAPKVGRMKATYPVEATPPVARYRKGFLRTAVYWDPIRGAYVDA
jgi:hypothetical protein